MNINENWNDLIYNFWYNIKVQCLCFYFVLLCWSLMNIVWDMLYFQCVLLLFFFFLLHSGFWGIVKNIIIAYWKQIDMQCYHAFLRSRGTSLAKNFSENLSVKLYLHGKILVDSEGLFGAFLSFCCLYDLANG